MLYVNHQDFLFVFEENNTVAVAGIYILIKYKKILVDFVFPFLINEIYCLEQF